MRTSEQPTVHLDAGSNGHSEGKRWTLCGTIVHWTATLKQLSEDVTCAECIRLELSPGR